MQMYHMAPAQHNEITIYAHDPLLEFKTSVNVILKKAKSCHLIYRARVLDYSPHQYLEGLWYLITF